VNGRNITFHIYIYYGDLYRDGFKINKNGHELHSNIPLILGLLSVFAIEPQTLLIILWFLYSGKLMLYKHGFCLTSSNNSSIVAGHTLTLLPKLFAIFTNAKWKQYQDNI
jgi:hypothetical protein